jgi:hypothetical protein
VPPAPDARGANPGPAARPAYPGDVERALSPITRETTREDGEVVREFDVASAATVIGAFIGALFLIFFLAAFVPWLLSKGMTSAVEGLMNRIGLGDFSADTIWDWFLVLVIFAAFTAFIVAICMGLLVLYNLLSKRTGMGLRVPQEKELAPPASRRAIAEPVDVDEEDEYDDLTFDDLYLEAQRRGIKGRSHMTKGQLRAALRRRKRSTRSRSR